MKTTKILFKLTSIVLLTLCMACSSDDGDGNSNGDEFLTASVDGADFAAAQDPAVIVGAQNTNGVLAVQGGTNSGETISLLIQGYNGVGTYAVADNMSNNNLAQYLTLTPTATTWLANNVTFIGGGINPGVIEVTTDDGTTVEGTFSFEGTDGSTVKTITNGKFKAKFD